MAKLTKKQLEQFDQDGFLVIENLLSQDEIQAMWDEYTVALDAAANDMLAQGKIENLYADLPFDERYVALSAENPTIFEYLNISMPFIDERYMAGQRANVHTGEQVFNLIKHPNILDVVESLIGPELYSNPIQHIRMKLPKKDLSKWNKTHSYFGRTLWHQDQAAVTKDAVDNDMITVWVAMTDALVENSCLVAMAGSHKKGFEKHCPGKTTNFDNCIPGRLLGDEEGQKRPTLLPVKAGGAVIMTKTTEHAATPNKTNKLRWSFDLRFNKVGQPTGRAVFPGFVARSRAHPELEVTDHQAYVALWDAAREKLSAEISDTILYDNSRFEIYRNDPACAISRETYRGAKKAPDWA